jgi:hypothetical protein
MVVKLLHIPKEQVLLFLAFRFSLMCYGQTCFGALTPDLKFSMATSHSGTILSIICKDLGDI